MQNINLKNNQNDNSEQKEQMLKEEALRDKGQLFIEEERTAVVADKATQSQFEKLQDGGTKVYEKMTPRMQGWLGKIDIFISYMVKKNFASNNKPMDYARGPMRFAIMVAIIVFLFFAIWGAFAPIDSAAVARGVITVFSSKKTIQHLEGGIISEIMVREGEIVKEGQPLVRLNDTTAKARQDIIISQLRLARATEARLIAERDGENEPNFNNIEILKEKLNPEIDKITRAQLQLFASRKSAVEGQIGVLNQRISQLNDEISGLVAQEKANDNQLGLINEEISTVSGLVSKGQALRPRLLSLQRQAAELQGNRGQYAALSAKARQAISETEMQMLNTKNDSLTKTLDELKETQATIADLDERLRASTDVLQRTVVVAPQEGRITGLKFHTVGGVVQPGAALMDIVPQADNMVIDAQLSPQDIDVVHQGQTARIRLTAFKHSRVPLIQGKVVNVSADRLLDQTTGVTYYSARIEIDQEMLSKLKNVTLYPGMPADVLIVTGERSMLSYILSPITDSFYKAFRED